MKKIPVLGAAAKRKPARAALAVIITAAALLFGGCGERLYIFTWTDYMPQSVVREFQREFNVRVIVDEYASNEEMLARLMTGRSRFDIAFPSGDFVAVMIELDMLERIDRSKIPNLENIDPVILAKKIWDPYMNYSVPYYYGAAGILVNTARVPYFERSWSIFSRTDLRGRMTMLDDMREVMGGALMYLGYSVNTRNPAQIEAARNLINNSWRPNLVRFDAEAFAIGYASGDFWVVHGHPESVFAEIDGLEDLRRDTVFFIPDEGGPSYIDSMVILRGARNIELAHKFINFIHRPEIYAKFVDEWGFPATVNVPARRYTRGPSMYTVEDLENTELVRDVGEAFDLYTDAWFNSIRIGN